MIQRLRRESAGHGSVIAAAGGLLGAWAVLAGPAGLLAKAAGLGPANVAAVLGCASLVVLGLAIYGPVTRSWLQLGWANGITLVRALLTCLLAAVLGAGALSDGLAWGVFAIGGTALLLDALDGWLARRRGAQSTFGARFDMEADAFLIVMLSLLILDLGKAGPWVLLSGLLRYLFVAGAWIWPWLGRPLPPSQRRRVVCAVQSGALLACLAPVVPAEAAWWLAAAGLGTLTLSFASDVLWLHAHAKPHSSARRDLSLGAVGRLWRLDRLRMGSLECRVSLNLSLSKDEGGRGAPTFAEESKSGDAT